MIDQLQDLQVLDWLMSIGRDALAAIVILALGLWLSGRVASIINKGAKRSRHIDDTLRPFLSSLARYAILIVTIISVLARVGVQTTSIVAALGAMGLAVGLALQGTLQNISAGLMLLVLRPFQVGDYIDASGISGTVETIGLFSTEMTTYDGVYQAVPNVSLWNTSILNYSRLPTRRLDVPVGIAYEDDVEKAMALLLDHLQQDSRVMSEPAPQVLVTGLGESSVDLSLRCWTQRTDFWTLKFELNKNAKLWLDTAGISIPFPQRDVHLIPTPDDTPSNT
ncbi:MAG: mechanosensitive ion channel [Arenicellales bacterium]|jgi:small conductance mechanosensitive channel|nr:mechanosensitive ion channel [Arenicellales bacterium]